MDEADWSRLINQLRRGDCTPFLGAGACAGTLPNGSSLSEHYAARYGYPFSDNRNLARVMQYVESVIRDPVDLKAEVCELLQARGHPPADDPNEPHALLAEFPLKTFLTTNYDDFLTVALRRAGKNPFHGLSHWWDTTSGDQPPLREPAAAEPLVYHLHGSWEVPQSLVLTEVDYLNFLVNMVDAPVGDGRHAVPVPVLRAMTLSPLLFLGYSLQDWTFRVLFHGLARRVPRSNKRRHVSVQLMPETHGSAVDPAEAADRARRYLVHYLEGWNISIFLGTAAEFCAELRERMGRMP